MHVWTLAQDTITLSTELAIAVGGVLLTIIGVLIRMGWEQLQGGITETRRGTQAVEQDLDNLADQVERVDDRSHSRDSDLRQELHAMRADIEDTFVRSEEIDNLKNHIDQKIDSLHELIETKMSLVEERSTD